MKDIVFIGAGNVATNLALTLHEKKYAIRQIYSRTENSAKALAGQVNAGFTTNLQDIVTDADIYFFSVKDSVLHELLRQLPSLKGIYLHTAGSLPMDIFKPFASNYGVFYPLQTFSRNRRVDFSVVPVCIEAANEDVFTQIYDLAKALSNRIFQVNSEKRKHLHLAAVFVCNFVNRMYDIGSEIVRKSDLPFDILLPLIDETSKKVHELSPFEAQTGPAVRFDKNVLEKHEQLIEAADLRKIYRLMSESIYKRHCK